MQNTHEKEILSSQSHSKLSQISKTDTFAKTLIDF